jgi:serine O-acetyltransferase
VNVGAGAKILGGIIVGDGAEIGANAVVRSDVPAGAVAVGVPARILPAHRSPATRDSADEPNGTSSGDPSGPRP